MARLEVISKETIKPSSPTPFHLKTFNLSFFDQFQNSSLYPSLLFFYPPNHHHHQDRRLRDLKSSLSETLTSFYPLAGNIIENEFLVDCTDEGVDFIDVKVCCRLSDILGQPDPTFLSELLPTKTVSVQERRILMVQANLFECGGIAVGVSICHKIADAATLSLFIKGWAAHARSDGDVVRPDMVAIASRFPTIRFPAGTRSDSEDLLETKPWKKRRYIFDSNNINALRIKATCENMHRPSRVEVVVGHIWLSMMKLKKTRTMSHVLIQLMNLRKRIDPPLSENSFGNLVGFFLTRAYQKEEEAIELEDLVGNIKKALHNESEKYKKNNINGRETLMTVIETGKEFMNLVERGDVGIAQVSSWCRLWLYENADFGWGKPGWISVDNLGLKNAVTLVDASDGDGIEAWVNLDEDDIDLLETNEDFLEFVSLNSSVDLD